MKKLLFVMAASFFSVAACAQVETVLTTQYDDCGAKELKCTEEAISFRANIRSGWQLHSFRMGYTDFVNTPSSFTLSKNHAEEDFIPEPIQLVKSENTFNQNDTYLDKSFMFPQKIRPRSLTQASRFASDYFFFNYSFFLQPVNFDFIMPPLN